MTAVSQDYEYAIKSAAEKLHADKAEWTTFYRDILGLRGMIRRYYPTIDALAKFEQTETYHQIQRMLADLRRLPPRKSQSDNEELKALGEDTRVITVRIPQSLHDALRIEAFEHRTSMNKLCISKLLQFIGNDHVPAAVEEVKEEANL